MIAVDSNILIYALTGRGEFAEASRAILQRASVEGGSASVLLIGEVLCKTDPELDHQIQQATQYVMNLKNITYQPVTSVVAEQAAKLVRNHTGKLRLADAIHLISALSAGAGEFWTNDKKLRTITIPGLRVKLLTGV